MRVLARIGFTLAGLAVVAPAGARAGLPIVAGAPWSPAQQQQQQQQAQQASQPSSKPSLFRSSKPATPTASTPERLCAECQRNRLKAQQGISVPPPPPLPPGTVIRANMCTLCGQPAAVLAGRLPAPSRMTPPQNPTMVADRGEPGRAVVGGDMAGYAAVGNDPAPIGMVQPRLAAAGAPGMMGAGMGQAGPGTRDGSVMPTAAATSPSDPVMPQHHSRPHIISHLLGLSAIGRERADGEPRTPRKKNHTPRSPTAARAWPRCKTCRRRSSTARKLDDRCRWPMAVFTRIKPSLGLALVCRSDFKGRADFPRGWGRPVVCAWRFRSRTETDRADCLWQGRTTAASAERRA